MKIIHANKPWLFLLFLFYTSLPLRAQIIAAWDASGLSAYGPSPFSSTSSNTNVTVGGLTRGSGVTTTPTAATRAWGGNGWDNLTASANITSNDFFTFTVKANNGYTMSITAINPFDYRRSSTGPSSGLLQYKLNAGSFIDITTISFSSTASGGASVGSTDLSAVSALQNLSSSVTVTFRVVPYGATNISGTFYIFDKGVSAANDFGLTGTVTCTPLTWYQDLDADTYGNSASSTSSCTAPLGYVADNTDCNDGNGAIHPGAAEACDISNIDEDCDGLSDDFDTDGATGKTNWYADADLDTYGDIGIVLMACDQPAGSVSDNTDCDDDDADAYPGQTWYIDGDGDTYGGSSVTQCLRPDNGHLLADLTGTGTDDCNDASADIRPGVSETCNGYDDNCNGDVDDEDAGITGQPTWYIDDDLDTYGFDGGPGVQSCNQPGGFVANNDDCLDDNGAIHPGAEEICNEADDDCSGYADDGLTFTTYYYDGDGDSYGDPATGNNTCQPAGSSDVTDNTDCNDGDAAVYPGAEEQCNEADDDCNGLNDDGLSYFTLYYDLDGDGYGNLSEAHITCTFLSGYASQAGDCEIMDPSIHPGADEVCNTYDDNCDGLVDGFDPLLTGGGTFYEDLDGDFYGNDAVSVYTCDAPEGYVSDGGDCDDTNDEIYPTGTESCNGEDDDCDGLSDEDLATNTYYTDNDDDGYGDIDAPAEDCSATAPSGFSDNSDDCDDTDDDINPAGTETCNTFDDDCDGSVDDNVVSATITPGGSTSICKGAGGVVLSANTGAGYSYEWLKNGLNIPGAIASNYTATKQGNYSVKVSVPGGCYDISDPVPVVFLATPVAEITNATGTNDLCGIPGIKLKANGGSGLTYLWLKNGVSTGITTAVLLVTTPGNYKVQVTRTSTGCVKVSKLTAIVKTCRIDMTEASDTRLNIYPNPNSGTFTLDLDLQNNSIAEATITVFDALGQPVMENMATAANGMLTENVSLPSNIAGGVYYIKVEAGNNSWMEQLILTK